MSGVESAASWTLFVVKTQRRCSRLNSLSGYSTGPLASRSGHATNERAAQNPQPPRSEGSLLPGIRHWFLKRIASGGEGKVEGARPTTKANPVLIQPVHPKRTHANPTPNEAQPKPTVNALRSHGLKSTSTRLSRFATDSRAAKLACDPLALSACR